jgi:hypothetical protein
MSTIKEGSTFKLDELTTDWQNDTPGGPVDESLTPHEFDVILPGKHGGARPGSGRKPGKDKLSGAGILQAIANRDVPFEVGLAEDYAKARSSGDMHVIQKYQSMILNKVVADKQELDVTSNGLTIGASFVFPSLELSDWQTQDELITNESTT